MLRKYSSPDLKKGMKGGENVELTFRAGDYGKDDKGLLQFYKKFYYKHLIGEKCRGIFQDWRKLASQNDGKRYAKKFNQIQGLIRVLNFSH